MKIQVIGHSYIGGMSRIKWAILQKYDDVVHHYYKKVIQMFILFENELLKILKR